MTAIDPKWPVAEGGMNRPLIVDIPSGRFWPIAVVHEQLHQLGFSGTLTEKGNSIAQLI